MFKTAPVQRSNVTIDDRRAAFVAAKGRRPRDVAAVPNEQFIRNMLKDRMGWPHRDPAPEALKAASREIATALSLAARVAAAKLDANRVAAEAIAS